MTLGEVLPSVNATLNATSAVFLFLGWRAVKAKRLEQHGQFMLAAFTSSTIFLVCYLVRAYLTGTHRYPGHGAAKAVYYGVLFTHMILAVALVPFVLRTLHLSAVKEDFARHRKVARITLPMWMYVSVTGVLVYLMLYHFA